MKHFLSSLVVVFFLLTTSELIMAQFTVKIPLTDNYGGLFKPIKADKSFKFQISVTNDRKDTCAVSIIKNYMAGIKSWVTIDDNDKLLFPGQKVDFLLTIKVPPGTSDGNYTLFLHFHVFSINESNLDFVYQNQTIIVDNSAPDTPTFSIGWSESTTVTVNNWHSYDSGSSVYTGTNSSSGVDGIHNYTITLTKPDHTTLVQHFIATDYDNTCFFSGLVSNTHYPVSVKATDVAGNSSIKSTIATTAPAPPENLSFSNTTYIETTLSWAPSPGTTGYNVYLFDGSKDTLLNSTPITANSYTITDLKPNTTYSFYVRALSNVGTSDWSDKASIKTLALPYITGPSLVCTGNYTFTLSSLVSDYSVSWNSSANLHLSSASDISAVFSVVNTGQGQISASITAPSGQVLDLTNKAVWVGKPSFYIYGDNDLMPHQPGMAVIYQNGTSVGMIESWSYYGPLSYFKGDISKARYRAGTQPGNGFIYATVRNACGVTENRMYYVVESFYNVYPNPADNVLSVESISSNKTASTNTNLNNKTTTTNINTTSSPIEIRLYDKMMHLKLKKTFNGKKTKINVSNLKPGIYILQIINGKNIYKKEIIVSHH